MEYPIRRILLYSVLWNVQRTVESNLSKLIYSNSKIHKTNPVNAQNLF
ncbi:MAG: hypothetical protein IPP06_06080 [Saprospiraceae bacterium]|nr:hypothetical protein [Candidatus Vicinibacter affinis]MBP6174255.1 hypothetical protein [Saprospiraceae bacterium]MBK6574429.1 hypothetical protein [Candidatus Vicinibacter affinis]MBK6824832.1 hypothetical protein [Candidatus Vicinibacter affinis]MBK7304535.1 hypothetical protein [Candidatus Vicinibacter affinis]